MAEVQYAVTLQMCGPENTGEDEQRCVIRGIGEKVENDDYNEANKMDRKDDE